MSDPTTGGIRPVIYIAGGLTKATDENLVIYGDIREGCNLAGFDAYLPHEDTGSRKDNLDPERVFGANIGAVTRSVAVVADVNVASHGVGIEIQYACSRGIPVIAIAHQQSDVSRMLLGHPGIVGRVVRYARRSQVAQTVKDALNAQLRGHGELRSRLISIEGPDFVGKSELHQRLVSGRELLEMPVLGVHDPPWDLSPWGDLKKYFRYENELSPIAEALLFGTARVDGYARRIAPALAKGQVVICDRFIDSWFAYQSVRLGDQGQQQPLEFVLAQHRYLEGAGAIITPGLTILLTATSEELARRAASRHSRDKYEGNKFQIRVARAYDELAERFPYRIVRLETTGRDKDQVFEMVNDIISEYTKSWKAGD